MKRVVNLVTSSWRKLGSISNSTQYPIAHSAEKKDKPMEVGVSNRNLLCLICKLTCRRDQPWRHHSIADMGKVKMAELCSITIL